VSVPPPDENTAVGPTGVAWVVWLVIVGPGLLFVTLACVRRVGTAKMLLVLRHGMVVRSHRTGFVTRWPGVERFEPVSTEPHVVPLVIRSRTCDGVDVVALADLTVQVRDVEVGTLWGPTSDLARIAEDSIGTEIRRLEVRSLVNDLDALQDRWRHQITRQLPTGTTALTLAVTEVDAQLTPRVADVISDEPEDGIPC
jgi:regulator of protease activity HflC (stomatin/prohibitin superfamily)